jgi:ferredoxin-NADP reductase
MFYVSGPEPMVAAMEKTLSDMGIPNGNIKKDFFQGYQES